MKSYLFSESELRDRYIDSIKEQLNVSVFYEIPVFSRSVDLVLQDNNKYLTAIEFKLHDWKQAIKQALCVEMCFDYLCIHWKASEE